MKKRKLRTPVIFWVVWAVVMVVLVQILLANFENFLD